VEEKGLPGGLREGEARFYLEDGAQEDRGQDYRNLEERGQSSREDMDKLIDRQVCLQGK